VKDLLKPGVRVAIGQPDQCTIGALTRRLLRHEGIYEKLLKENVVTEAETSALLVPSITTAAADATLAYRTDTLAESDKVDVIPIDSELSKAIQPFSIARSSKQKHLARRLYQAIAKSRDAFETAGFNWRLDASEPVAEEPVPDEPDADANDS
jgi:molybdate transport system substrate-binding protein